MLTDGPRRRRRLSRRCPYPPHRHGRRHAAVAGSGSALRWEVAQAPRPATARKARPARRACSARSRSWSIIHGQSRPPKDTLFGRFATDNGFALALLVLGFASQWVLPLLTAIVAGDIFASEDQHGTWKTVLTRSTSRAQLFWAKTLAAVGFAVARARAAGRLDHRRQPAHRRPPAADRPVRPDHRRRRRAAAGRRQLGDHAARRCSASPAWRSCSRSGRATPPSASPHPSCIGMVMQLVGALGGVEADPPAPAHHPVRGLARPARRTRGSPGRSLTGLLVSAGWSVALASAAAFLILRRRDITGG